MPPVFKYRFVDFGTHFKQSQDTRRAERTQKDSDPDVLFANEIATNVGGHCWLAPDRQWEIDHHFSDRGQFPSASAAVLHLSRRIYDTFHGSTGVVWLVGHKQPTFDSHCSHFLVKCLEGQKRPDWSRYGIAEDGWIDTNDPTSGAPVKKIDWYQPLLQGIPKESRWLVHLGSFASMVHSSQSIHCTPHRALHAVLHAAIHRGRDYENEDTGATEFFEEVKKILLKRNINPALDSVLEGNERFAPELAYLDREVEAYARDVRRARKTIVYLPRSNGPFRQLHEELKKQAFAEQDQQGRFYVRKVHLNRGSTERQAEDGIYIRDPECLLFTEWAHIDTQNSPLHKGFLFTAVAISGNRPQGSLNTTDYIFSLDPVRSVPQGLHLYTVWTRLQLSELDR